MGSSEALWREAGSLRVLADRLMADAKEAVRVLYRQVDTLEFNATLQENSERRAKEASMVREGDA